jgi:hypothetical protein
MALEFHFEGFILYFVLCAYIKNYIFNVFYSSVTF